MTNWEDFVDNLYADPSEPMKENWSTVRRLCVRMANEELVTGSVLYHIFFWSLPKKNGEEKGSIYAELKGKKGKKELVLAKDYKEFQVELGSTPKQTKLAIDKLEALELVERVHNGKRFYGNHTTHLWFNRKKFVALYYKAKAEQTLASTEDKKRIKKAVENRKNAREAQARQVFQNVVFAQ